MEDKDKTRFWSKVTKQDNGCWTWNSTKNPEGYGIFFCNGKLYKAHRVAYRLAKGEIGKGLFVCHSCDVRACCNPDHLWLGTPSDNTKDAWVKGRIPNLPLMKGEKHPLAKLSDSDREEIKVLQKQGTSYRALGRMFNVSSTTIHAICNGKDYSCRKKKNTHH